MKTILFLHGFFASGSCVPAMALTFHHGPQHGLKFYQEFVNGTLFLNHPEGKTGGLSQILINSKTNWKFTNWLRRAEGSQILENNEDKCFLKGAKLE